MPMINHPKVVLAIIYHKAGSGLGVEIDLMTRSLRNLTSIIRNTKNTKNTRNTKIKRSTKSITLPSLKREKVQKNEKALKRESRARIGMVREDIIIIAVIETSNHPEVEICNHLLLPPNLIDVKDTHHAGTSRATVALAFHQIGATEEMNLEVVGFLHRINLNLLLTSMGELNMRRAKIATMITTTKVVEAITTAADSTAVTQSSNSSRVSHPRNSAGSLIFVS